ncbi:hypothetical protein V8C34DRAFT_318785 [Trichoderma compactum]
MSLRMHEIIEQRDPAAFHPLLCNVTLAAARFTGSPERHKEESVIHHNAAVSNVLSRLRVTGKEQAASLVLPILALAQHANIYRDFTKFEVHFTALQNVVQIGGVLDNMTLEPYTCLLLLFVEVNARARNDSLPLFPLPTDLLECFQVSFANIEYMVHRDLVLTCPFRTLFPDGMDSFAQILCDTKRLGETLNEYYRTMGDKLWTDARISGFRICVLLHKLLSIQSQSFGYSMVTQSLGDATRISALLGLAAVRRRFLAFQIFTDIHLTKFKDLLNFHFPTILCTEAADLEDWSWFATGISRLAAQLEVESWAAAMMMLRNIF